MDHEVTRKKIWICENRCRCGIEDIMTMQKGRNKLLQDSKKGMSAR